ncbi:MAG: hypothetical protein ACRD10_06800, partial [Terriglobia bacterium]
MKLALFDDYIPGLVTGDQIVDLSAAVGKGVMDLIPAHRMTAIIADFGRVHDRIADAAGGPGKALSGIRLRAP